MWLPAVPARHMGQDFGVQIPISDSLHSSRTAAVTLCHLYQAVGADENVTDHLIAKPYRRWACRWRRAVVFGPAVFADLACPTAAIISVLEAVIVDSDRRAVALWAGAHNGFTPTATVFTFG